MSKLAMSALSLPARTLPFVRVDAGNLADQIPSKLPISVLIAAKNEARNLSLCLESVRNFDEVVVVDSQSSDMTVEIARSFGTDVVQFYYRGGWPKKRQWALDNLTLRHAWVLLLDADEAVPPDLEAEMRQAVKNPEVAGYYIALEMFFLGKRLRHSGASFRKLSLFRRNMGRFECRTIHQDSSMCDMEVHEHVVVRGPVVKLKNKIIHRNVESLYRYIQKHNEYSNWEARVWGATTPNNDSLPPSLFKSQAQRRRWLRSHFLRWPGSPLAFFLYKYLFRAGFLDGIPGLIYCALQGIQIFHIKAKLYEQQFSLAIVPEKSEANVENPSYVRH